MNSVHVYTPTGNIQNIFVFVLTTAGIIQTIKYSHIYTTADNIQNILKDLRNAPPAKMLIN